MTLVALSMNVLLIVLLLAALGFGVRLDRRLKGVRDGQAAFTLAVHELNAAAAKAQNALAELRAATDEATDHLGGRIARAREAADRLEKLTSRAEYLPSSLPREPAREAPAREDSENNLAALLGAVEKSDAAPSIARLLRSAQRRPAPALRGGFDDDLFEDAGGRA